MEAFLNALARQVTSNATARELADVWGAPRAPIARKPHNSNPSVR